MPGDIASYHRVRRQESHVVLKTNAAPVAAGPRVDREVAWLFPYCGKLTLASLEQVGVPASHTRYV